MFFRFPPDAHWNAVRGVVEFGIGIGEYEGIVRVPREVFRRLLWRCDPREMRGSVPPATDLF
jgi:hypothetical protein